MINILLTMTLTGSSVVVLWWLLAKLSGDRFSVRLHYGVLKLGIFAFLVPVEQILLALVSVSVPETAKIPTDVLAPAAPALRIGRHTLNGWSPIRRTIPSPCMTAKGM